MDASALDPVRRAYAAFQEKALTVWSQSSEAGDPVPLPYHETHLAYTIGTVFQPPENLQPLVAELEDLTASDTRVSMVPRRSLHFTFLALTPHTWAHRDQMPDPAVVINTLTRHMSSVQFELTDLRLLPAPNGILLAGLPTVATITVRNRIIADLLETPAGDWMKARYGKTFPPIFWHTTLARSRTALCPQSLRQLYHKYSTQDYGSLRLPCPRLVAANFDWSIHHPIA